MTEAVAHGHSACFHWPAIAPVLDADQVAAEQPAAADRRGRVLERARAVQPARACCS